MTFQVRWAVEGTTTLEAKNIEDAVSEVGSILTEFDLPNYIPHATKYRPPQILEVTED